MPRDNARLRSDASRNRKLIVEAATAMFSAHGMSVGIDDIAERAGVGVGTLYRNFPTKEALFSAVVENRLIGLVQEAEVLAATSPPGEAFFKMIELIADEASSKSDIVDALNAVGIDIKKNTSKSQKALRAVLATTFTQAQSEGSVRNDVTPDEIWMLLITIARAAADTKKTGGSGSHLMAVLFDGLRSSRP